MSFNKFQKWPNLTLHFASCSLTLNPRIFHLYKNIITMNNYKIQIKTPHHDKDSFLWLRGCYYSLDSCYYCLTIHRQQVAAVSVRYFVEMNKLIED